MSEPTNGDSNGWRERINGFGKPGLIAAVSAGVIYAVVQWPVSYIKEGHDRGIEHAGRIAALERSDEETKREKARIAELAAQRGEYIRNNEARIADLNARITRLEQRR